MTADRTDDEQAPESESDPDSGSGSGSDSDVPPSVESTDADDDSLTIPSVSTEDAGSGLWSDLKADFRDEEIDLPDGSSAPSDPFEPSTDETDVDLSEIPNDLIKTFTAVVIAVNGAVLAVSLGILFLVFEGVTTRGVGLLVGGLVLAGFAVRRYRSYRDSSDASESESESNSDFDERTDSPLETGRDPDPESEPETESEAPSEPDTGAEP